MFIMLTVKNIQLEDWQVLFDQIHQLMSFFKKFFFLKFVTYNKLLKVVRKVLNWN